MSNPKLQAALCTCLAEALAEPSADWLAAQGRDWPLYAPLLKLAAGDGNPRWRDAILKVKAVRAGEIEIRRREFRHAISPAMLYECRHLDGRFPGPTTFTVKNLYRQAGVEVDGAEMPDHASLELAFLAYLWEQEACDGEDAKAWRAVRRNFTKNHARKWLPGIAQILGDSDFPAWRAVGVVLAASLENTPKLQRSIKKTRVYPKILAEEGCNLCGFCVQICPCQALHIHEDETQTELWLQPEKCIGCRKCEKVCSEGTLVLAEMNITKPAILHRSARARCPNCGAPTVSQSELNAVAARLGEQPDWLYFCMECR